MFVKGGYFAAAGNSTGILQRDLLCNGSEATLLECTQSTSGTRDCPADHSEDAGVKCNGTYFIFQFFLPFNFSFLFLCLFLFFFNEAYFGSKSCQVN